MYLKYYCNVSLFQNYLIITLIVIQKKEHFFPTNGLKNDYLEYFCNSTFPATANPHLFSQNGHFKELYRNVLTILNK